MQAPPSQLWPKACSLLLSSLFGLCWCCLPLMVYGEPVDFRPIQLNRTTSAQLAEQEQTDWETLSLVDVVELAQNQNLDIAMAQADQEAARGTYWSSFSGLIPSLQLSNSRERFEGGEVFVGANPVSLNRTTYRPTASAAYEIPLGGKSIFRVLSGKSTLRRSQHNYAAIQQQVLAECLNEYFWWLRDRTKIFLAEQSLKEARAQKQLAEKRLKSGFATNLDVMQSTTLELERQSLKLQAQDQERISKISLATLLNLDPSSNLQPSTTNIYPLELVETTEVPTVAFLQAGRSYRPDLKSLDAEINRLKNEYRQVRSDLLPTLAVGTYYRGIGPKQFEDLQGSYQNQISLNWDVSKSLGAETIGAMKNYHAQVEYALYQKQKQLNEAEKGILEALSKVKFQEQQRQVSRQQVIAAREAYKIALARTKEGFGIYLDVLKAQTDLTEARVKYVEAIAEYNNAQVRLLYEIGELTPENILEALRNSAPLAYY